MRGLWLLLLLLVRKRKERKNCLRKLDHFEVRRTAGDEGW